MVVAGPTVVEAAAEVVVDGASVDVGDDVGDEANKVVDNVEDRPTNDDVTIAEDLFTASEVAAPLPMKTDRVSLVEPCRTVNAAATPPASVAIAQARRILEPISAMTSPAEQSALTHGVRGRCLVQRRRRGGAEGLGHNRKWENFMMVITDSGHCSVRPNWGGPPFA